MVGGEDYKNILQENLVPKMKIELEGVLSDYQTLFQRFADNESSCVGDISVPNIEAKIKNLQKKYFLIQQADLHRLAKEIKMMRDVLPKTLNKELLNAPLKLKEKDIGKHGA